MVGPNRVSDNLPGKSETLQARHVGWHLHPSHLTENECTNNLAMPTERQAVHTDTHLFQLGHSGADIDGIAPQPIELGHHQHIAPLHLVQKPYEPFVLFNRHGTRDRLGYHAMWFDLKTHRGASATRPGDCAVRTSVAPRNACCT